MTLTIGQLIAQLTAVQEIAGPDTPVFTPREDPTQANPIGNLELWPDREGTWELHLTEGDGPGGGETRMRYAATHGGVLGDWHQPFQRPPMYVVPTWTEGHLEPVGPSPEVAQRLRRELEEAPDDAEDCTSPDYDALAARVYALLKTSGA